MSLEKTSPAEYWPACVDIGPVLGRCLVQDLMLAGDEICGLCIVNTIHSAKVGLMLSQRRRRCPNIHPTLAECMGFSVEARMIWRLILQTLFMAADFKSIQFGWPHETTQILLYNINPWTECSIKCVYFWSEDRCMTYVILLCKVTTNL